METGACGFKQINDLVLANLGVGGFFIVRNGEVRLWVKGNEQFRASWLGRGSVFVNAKWRSAPVGEGK